MGGEKYCFVILLAFSQGSPPHGRGKDVLPNSLTCPVWITPAWAGKRCQRCNKLSISQDHPRMGGEKSPCHAVHQRRQGSPPHGRGKVGKGKCGVKLAGITPAWAGKSAPQSGPGRYAQDHPRMGGEKLRAGITARPKGGSPPHGRGKADLRQSRGSHEGITPAWAGKR